SPSPSPDTRVRSPATGPADPPCFWLGYCALWGAVPQPERVLAGSRVHGSSRERNTTPVAGLGWKKVDLGGMRSPPCATSTIWLTETGRTRTPYWASPEATRAVTDSTPCW